MAIFGWPLTYTLSPAFQTEALRRNHVAAAYLALPVETGAAFLRLARGLMSSPHFVGANVTNPHKAAALGLAGRLSPEARAIGAVNTLYRRGGLWVGHNTDAHGVAAALQRARARVRGGRVLVLGAGGAARAVVWTCARGGARRVVVLARRRSRARDAAALAGSRGLGGDLAPGAVGLASLGADLVVNTLPGEELGRAFGGRLARAPKAGAAAFDLGTVPARTAFLAEAGLRGWRGIGGRDMLLEQGRAAFACWFGFQPAAEPLRQVLRQI